MLPRQQMIATIERVFQRFGFAPLQTPALEYAALLLGKYGDEGDKLLFRFLDNGQRDVAMRYDLTVPLARLLGTHRDTVMPFKRYQIGPVWRAEKPARGRFREFVQCDIDTVGVKELTADGEIVSAGIAALREILAAHDASEARAKRGGTPAVTLRLSNRKLLTALCVWLGVPEGGPAITLFRTLDKLDKQGEGAVRELLARDCLLDAAQIERVFQYLHCPATVSDFEPLRVLFGDNAIATLGMQELEEVIRCVRDHGYGEYLALDLSIARGLDYYTSTIYETSLNALDGFGSVMSGGRYDKLLAKFTGKDTPAVGISVGLDRLLAGLIELGLADSRPTPAVILVTVFSPEQRAHATALAQTLRTAGHSVELQLSDDKLGKQFRAADRKHIPYVLICGPDEQAQGLVKIKRLATGEEKTLPQNELSTWSAQ
jgi:histidyl-tRNA synthetase